MTCLSKLVLVTGIATLALTLPSYAGVRPRSRVCSAGRCHGCCPP